jgi:hypothetical protein
MPKLEVDQCELVGRLHGGNRVLAVLQKQCGMGARVWPDIDSRDEFRFAYIDEYQPSMVSASGLAAHGRFSFVRPFHSLAFP